MSEDEVFVGLDLGTSSLKGAAIAGDGRLIATAQAAYPTSRPRGGRAEQDPADWWDAACSVVRELSARTEPWAGIGLSGMIPTLVLAASEPLGPAITWEDDRAASQGERFRERTGPDDLYARTGQWVDGRYLLPMFEWLQEEEPARAGAATRLMSAKDHIFEALTGEFATDASTATGFGCFDLRTGAWIEGLASDALALPEVRPSTSAAALSADAAEALGLTFGLPVYLGAADSVAGALGMGAARPGERASIWGTSTVMLGFSRESLRDPAHRYLVTPSALGDCWGLEMDLISTGSTFAWTTRLLGLASEANLLELAERSAPGAGGLTFLPFLGSGEQGALWDPSLRGTISGLTLAHTREDFARALLEGIAIEFRRCMGVLTEAGVPADQVAVSGGPFGSASFAGLLAGASGIPIVRSEIRRWSSAAGAALIAAVGAGAIETNSLPVSSGHRSEPDPGSDVVWEALAARHEAQLASVRSL